MLSLPPPCPFHSFTLSPTPMLFLPLCCHLLHLTLSHACAICQPCHHLPHHLSHSCTITHSPPPVPSLNHAITCSPTAHAISRSCCLPCHISCPHAASSPTHLPSPSPAPVPSLVCTVSPMQAMMTAAAAT